MNEYELYHASTRKHKYIKKIGNRYFYTQQEIAAYLKEKRGQAGEFNEAGVKATQYDNNKTRRINEETRKQGRQKLKNMALKPTHDLRKQAARGKKAIDKWYTKATTPDISVTYDEPVIKSGKSSNSVKKSKKRQLRGNTQDLGSGLSVTYDEAVIKDDKSSKKKRRRG